MHSRCRLTLLFFHLYTVLCHTAYMYNTSKFLSSEDGWKSQLECCYLQLQIDLGSECGNFFHKFPSFTAAALTGHAKKGHIHFLDLICTH